MAAASIQSTPESEKKKPEPDGAQPPNHHSSPAGAPPASSMSCRTAAGTTSPLLSMSHVRVCPDNRGHHWSMSVELLMGRKSATAGRLALLPAAEPVESCSCSVLTVRCRIRLREDRSTWHKPRRVSVPIRAARSSTHCCADIENEHCTPPPRSRSNTRPGAGEHGNGSNREREVFAAEVRPLRSSWRRPFFLR